MPRRKQQTFRADYSNPNGDVLIVHSRVRLCESGEFKVYGKMETGNPPIANAILNQIEGVESLSAGRYEITLFIGKAFSKKAIWGKLKTFLAALLGNITMLYFLFGVIRMLDTTGSL